MALGGTLIAGLSVIRCSGGSTMSLLPGSTRIVESSCPVPGAATVTSPLTGTFRVVPGLSAWPLSSVPPLCTATLPPTGMVTVNPPCPAGRLICMIRAVAGFCLLKRAFSVANSSGAMTANAPNTANSRPIRPRSTPGTMAATAPVAVSTPPMTVPSAVKFVAQLSPHVHAEAAYSGRRQNSSLARCAFRRPDRGGRAGRLDRGTPNATVAMMSSAASRAPEQAGIHRYWKRTRDGAPSGRRPAALLTRRPAGTASRPAWPSAGSRRPASPGRSARPPSPRAARRRTAQCWWFWW